MQKILNGLLILSLSGLSFATNTPAVNYNSDNGTYKLDSENTYRKEGTYQVKEDGSVQINRDTSLDEWYNANHNILDTDRSEQIEAAKKQGWKKTDKDTVSQTKNGVTKTIKLPSSGPEFSNSTGTNIKYDTRTMKINGQVSKDDIDKLKSKNILNSKKK